MTEPQLQAPPQATSPVGQDTALGVIVCVNYESTSHTEAFVASIRSQALGDRIDVVLVDNSPSLDPRLRALEQGDERLWLRRPGTNLGYFGGANAGLMAYLESHELPEWVVVSNVDIVFRDRSFFERLVALDLASDVAVVAPSTRVGGTGREQNPFLWSRPPRRTLVAKRELLRWEVTYRLWLLANRWRRRPSGAGRDAAPVAEPAFVYAAHGAFVVLHRRFFERGGDIDYPLSLYGEEVFVAETARRIGCRVLFDPRLGVVHNEHVSTSKLQGKRSILFRCTSFLLDTFYDL